MTEITLSYNDIHYQMIFGEDFKFTGRIKSVKENRDEQLIYLEVTVIEKKCFWRGFRYYNRWLDARFFNTKLVEISNG